MSQRRNQGNITFALRSPRVSRPRRGFTLVEMLVVIVIIGILSGLITGAAVMARNAARRTAIVAEIHDMELALGAYKEKFGDYPPNFPDNDDDSGDDMNAINRHLARAFPRYPASSPDPSGQFTYKWQKDIYDWFTAFFQRQGMSQNTANQNAINLVDSSGKKGPDPKNGGLTGSMALAFWLGGLPDDNFNPTGFSANPIDPFDTLSLSSSPYAPTPSRIGPFYEFDVKRLNRPDGAGTVPNVNDPNFFTQYFLRYFPKNGNSDSKPYVYFGRRYYRLTDKGVPIVNGSGENPLNAKDCPLPTPGTADGYCYVRPYYEQSQIAQITQRGANVATYLSQARNADSVWVNPTKFQIICPGLDGVYCNADDINKGNQPGNAFPTGSDYISGQFDDITNFSGGTLKDKMP